MHTAYVSGNRVDLIFTPPAFADNVVNLKILVITAGDETQDLGLAYIKPALDEMDVPYDLLNAETDDLTAAMLASSSRGIACSAVEVGCVGSYNGIILTNSDLASNFSPSEWDILHDYQKDFQVRKAVLSGWPGTYWDPDPRMGSTWITVLLIRLAELPTKVSGQCLMKIARQFLSM